MDFIEIDVRRDGEKCLVIQHARRLEPSIPEVARHILFAIPAPGARLFE
jgi:hypothetical protein